MNILNTIKYIIILLMVLFIEADINFLFAIKDITPDLVLVLVVIICLKEERIPALLIGFAAGLLQDAFSTHFFGLYALSKTCTVFIGSQFRQSKKEYNLVYYASTFLLLVFIHEIISQFIFSFGADIGFFNLIFFYIFPRAIYTLIFAILVYLIFHKKLWQSRVGMSN